MSRSMSCSALALLFCFGIFSFLHCGNVAAQAALPAALDSAHYDWVCVTDGALTDAYAPLAAQRRAQGLATLIVDLEQVLLWSPAGDDTVATLRWLAEVAAGQWGAHYLLLGGSHALLPSPMFRLTTYPADYVNPTDACYRCPGGEWDADGDGFVAEWGEDLPDPQLVIIVGRVPFDREEDVEGFVAKVLSFEQRPPASAPTALFVASHLGSTTPPVPCPSPSVMMTASLRDFAVSAQPTLEAESLFEDCTAGNPATDPAGPATVLAALRAVPHELVHFQVQGDPAAWQLADLSLVHAGDFISLTAAGHAFLATVLSGPVADTREGGVLASLLALPGGGAAGAIAPSCMGYVYPHGQFMNVLWGRLLADDGSRLGDAFQEALMATQSLATTSSMHAATYWGMCLLGDPATRLWPASGTTGTTLPAQMGVARLRVVPNPFNPTTTIRFDVQAPAGRRVPARVEVFDLQGRQIRTLLAESLPPGPREVIWHADVVSGVYLVRVTVGGSSASAKLTLLE